LNTTVAEILDAYLDGLKSEREFDAPFVVLLRGLGFFDIHFLHGKWEFGKDFIAKRVEAGRTIQYAFQTKGGDLDLSAWRDARHQVDELRRNVLGHPRFDRALDRRAVFVTTGRLVGAAPTEAQEYKRYLEEDLHELSFETWERGELVDYLQQVPLLGVSPATSLVRALVDIDEDAFPDAGVERVTSRWIEAAYADRPWAAALEAAIVAGALGRRNRDDLAAEVGVGLVRAAWFWETRSGGSWPTSELSRIGRLLFASFAFAVWGRCAASDLDPVSFIADRGIPFPFVGYPVASLKLANLLGLLVLLLQDERQTGLAPGESTADTLVGLEVADEDRIRTFLARFAGAHPGVRHPISDRWAVPLLNAVVALGSEQELAASVLREAARWLVGRYDDGLGLAGWGADESTEVRFLLGGPLEHVTNTKRDQSYLATVILDLCAVLGIGDLYEDLRADLTSAGIFPTMLEVPDTTAQYVRDDPELRQVPNVPYQAFESRHDWCPSPVHARLADSYVAMRSGRAWDLMAIATLLRGAMSRAPSESRRTSPDPRPGPDRGQRS
jgi:hypothetical protein